MPGGRTYMKRRSLLLLSLLCAGVNTLAQRQLVMPPSLKPGDTIAIVSPSSVPETSTVEKGCEALRKWGYIPVVAPHALSKYHGFAGTADERASDLKWALTNPSIRAIMCSRGGDGAVQVLLRVPLQQFARNPKWVVGFSDVTALHSAMVSAGVMSIHGSMCDGIASHGVERDSVNAFMRDMLRGQLPTYKVPPHQLDQPGQATGLLVGGNMSVFCALAGSRYDFLNRANEGIILFIEDTSESIAKVDRMLHHLEIRGVLKLLRGVVVGHFSKYKYPENDYADMYDMLHEYLQHYNIPVCYDFPSGHHSRLNLPLVEGCRVRLTVDGSGTELEFIHKQQ